MGALRQKLYYLAGKRFIKHRPCKGAESASCGRPSPNQLAELLQSYDVVSFDIFDTLLLRPFSKPTDLFLILAKRLNIPDFRRLRIECERDARECASGSREINIYQIYELIEQRSGLPSTKGVKEEYETEKRYLYANPYMIRLFNILKELGKTVIIVSDMYLPHDLMEQILHEKGYLGYDRLYVSCDCGCGKCDGGLFRCVNRDYAGKKIAHIGDNLRSDINNAKICGIKGIYYKSVSDAGNKYRAEGMSELVGSAYCGILNNRLHSGVNKFDPSYEFGFIYVGLYVFGFCCWIYRKAKKAGAEKILFLACEDSVCKRVFDECFPEIPNECFPQSGSAKMHTEPIKDVWLEWEKISEINSPEKEKFTSLISGNTIAADVSRIEALCGLFPDSDKHGAEKTNHIEYTRNGVFDFCKIYHDTFAKDSFMYDISAHDAYMPIRFGKIVRV